LTFILDQPGPIEDAAKHLRLPGSPALTLLVAKPIARGGMNKTG
jgi:hypothetical protein